MLQVKASHEPSCNTNISGYTTGACSETLLEQKVPSPVLPAGDTQLKVFGTPCQVTLREALQPFDVCKEMMYIEPIHHNNNNNNANANNNNHNHNIFVAMRLT